MKIASSLRLVALFGALVLAAYGCGGGGGGGGGGGTGGGGGGGGGGGSTPPGAFTLSAPADSLTNVPLNNVTFTWTASSNAATYTLRVSLSSSMTSPRVSTARAVICWRRLVV